MKIKMRYSLMILLMAWVLWKGIIPSWNLIHSDFANYYVSSRLVVEQGELEKLYDNEWFQKQIKEHGIDEPGKFSPFPPITAWIMVPLTFTDALSAKRIWTIINCLLLVACIYLISILTGWHWSLAITLMLATANGLVNNFRFGQVYLLITASMFMVIRLVDNKKRLAGFLLATIAAIKYLPIALALGFLIRKQFTMLIYAVVSLLFLIVAQFLFFGPLVMREFFYSAFVPHLDGNLSGQGMYSFLFQSYDNFFRHVFVYSADYNPSPVIDWPQGRTVGKVIVYLAVLGTMFLSLRKVVSLQLQEKTSTSLLLSIPVLAVFVVLPASASYHFVMLVVPVTLLLSSEFFNKLEKTIIGLSFIFIGLIPYQLFFAFAEQAGLVFAYPRLWLISILYFGVVWMIMFRTHPAERPS